VAKKQKNKDEERSVDIDHLEPDLKSKAFDLGFRKRVSVNKVARVLEHEKWWARLCMVLTGVGVLASIGCFAARIVLSEEKKGHFLMMGLFAALWALGSWAYAKRAARLEKASMELLAVVKAKLGKD